MESFREQKFNLPKIEGVSERQIEEHLKLYRGYVNHSNKILEQIEEWKKDEKKNSYFISESRRRFSFEFDGMRSHEYYFGALEDGPKSVSETLVAEALSRQFGDLDKALKEFAKTAMTRGSGWAMMYWDDKYERFEYQWIDEHHLGHLSGLDIILALDAWEHAFMIDYAPGERAKYIDSYLKAVNWQTIDSWFLKARGKARSVSS